MVTAERAETKTAKTMNRSYLIQLQVRNLLARTGETSQEWLAKIDIALALQWVETIGVYGLDSSGRCHVGMELQIDWVTHNLRVLLVGDDIAIDRTVYSDDVAPEVINGIAVFNQAVNAECLRTKWRLTHPAGVDMVRIRKELGLVLAAPLQWAGDVEKKHFPVPELPELTVTFLQAVQDCRLSEVEHEKGLFDRIKATFG
jgi:hypothetical protein